MSFDPISSAKGAFSSIAAGANAISNLGSAISSGNPSKVLSAIRSINLPKGGQNGGAESANATFVTDTNKDWRVKLTLPGMSDVNEVFSKGEILKPIRAAGGLIFPYTPTISISHNVTYGEQALTHQNYQFIAYQNSKVSDIQIIGDFYVQDWIEAQYWIAAVHFLRSVTKMYAGDNAYVGNPPPILKFSAYGDYVFNNVPVVVKNFSVTLPKEVDFISVDITKPSPGTDSGSGEGASKLDKISSNAKLLSGVASAFGATKASKVLNFISNGANVAKVLSGGDKSATKDMVLAPTHVPTQSQVSVTVTPVYSRTQVRQFNLADFVKGGYQGKGYL